MLSLKKAGEKHKLQSIGSCISSRSASAPLYIGVGLFHLGEEIGGGSSVRGDMGDCWLQQIQTA